MTATFQTSFFSTLENNSYIRRNKRHSRRLFQVDSENFDNEVEIYKIEAADATEAAEIAESRFGGDVYNMNIYDMGY